MDFFAFDVDGTLVTGNTPMGDEERVQMNRLLAEGDAVAIASGRPLSGAMRYLNELNPSPLKFAITANGSATYRISDGKLLDSHLLTYADYLFIRREYKTPSRVIYLYDGNVLASHDHHPVLDMEMAYSHMAKFVDLNAVHWEMTHPINKVIVCAEKLESLKMEKEIQPDDRKRYSVLRSSDVFVEFVNPEADKAKGVEVIRKLLGIDKAHVHTFGDSMNDLQMIEGYDGTAMGNAMPKIQSVAKRVTKTVQEHGVAYALKTYFND